MARALVAFALLAAAASAARVQSTEFTYLGDLLPIHTKATGYAPFQVNKRWYQNGFNQFVLKNGKKTIEHFKHGVFTHAPANVHYHIEGKYAAFEACVGLDAYAGANVKSCNNHDGVEFRVKIDGKRIWSLRKKMGEPQTCFRLSLEVVDPSKNAQTLELDVDKLQNSDCDEAEWTNAKLFEDPVVDCQQLGSLVPSYHSVGWGSYWVNRRWHDNGFEIAGVRYSNGVFAHAPSKIIYPLHGKFDTFSACVGLDDGVKQDGYSSKDCGRVAFKVFVDGKQQKLTGGQDRIIKAGMDPVSCFAVNTYKGKHLELVVDHMGSSRCDESEWVNANVCREKPKAVDCQTSEWSNWNACSKSCGTGYQTRTRKQTKAAKWGGRACKSLVETRACKTESCPIDCLESKWSEWVRCSKTCGGGVSFRYRSEDRSAAFGGKACKALQEKKVCGTIKCPIDCQVTEWSHWDKCTEECGGGTQWQRRTVISPAQHNGRACPALSQKRACNSHPCSIDCQMTEWSEWTTCSVKCGGGTQYRTRRQSRLAQHGGKACPSGREDRDCNISECPINCKLSAWGAFPACSATCGGGRRTRYRSIEVTAAFGGKACDALTQTEACNSEKCPIDCLMGGWGPWQKCDKTCGGGQEQRFRDVQVDAMHGGRACGARTQARPCNVHSCPRDCVDKGFGSWSKCTKSCGAGSQTRHRTIIPAKYGGVPCPPRQMKQTQQCNTRKCPVDCKVSGWSPWSTCDKKCGGGKMFRTRAHISDPQQGGKGCPALRQERTCNKHSCPEDCKFTPFTPWTTCTKSCGGGFQKRKRVVTRAAKHGGKCRDQYGGLTQTRPCESQPCPVDCVVGDFGAPSKCSHACTHAGEEAWQYKKRPILQNAMHGGKKCPALELRKPCATQPPRCPVNCVWGEWSAWSKCSNDCGGGIQEAKRTAKIPGQFGGASCAGATIKKRSCNKRPCPAKCIVTNWAGWGKCSRSCGKGVMIRKRGVTTSKGRNGGMFTQACPAGHQTRECNLGACPLDCEVEQWGAWTACSKTCGGGFTSRTRGLLRAPKNGGKKCPEMNAVEFCNTRSCPRKAEPWTPYVHKKITAKFGTVAKYSEIVNKVQSTTTRAPATTTKFVPVKINKKCYWGIDATTKKKKYVVHGWAGAGYGDQFCNLLTCKDGKLVGEGKNARDCRAPFRHQGRTCKSISCKYEYSFEAGHELMHVTHKQGADQERSNHHCAYNLATMKCACKCYDSNDSAGRPVILQWSQE